MKGYKLPSIDYIRVSPIYLKTNCLDSVYDSFNGLDNTFKIKNKKFFFD